MRPKLQPGYVSIIAVLALTAIMLLMLTASFRFSVQSQDTQKKSQLRIDYANREQAILRSVLNIAPNRAMRTMMAESDNDPIKTDLMFSSIFSDAIERANAETAVSADVSGVLGLTTNTISGNTADADYGHARTVVGPLGQGLASGFYVTPGINTVSSTFTTLPETLTLDDATTVFRDTRWPIITTDKFYSGGNEQYKVVPYPDVHFGYRQQDQNFVAKRNWWGFSMIFGAEDSGSSGVTTMRKNYILSIYEVPSQLGLGSTTLTYFGQHADGSDWSNVNVRGGVFATKAATVGNIALDRVSTKKGISLSGTSSVGGVAHDAFSGDLPTREEFEAANSGFFPMSNSSDSGLVAFVSINQGEDAFDDLTGITHNNRLSTTNWASYSRPAMQCTMKLRVEDVISSSDQTPTTISFTYKVGGFDRTDYYTRGTDWPTENSPEGATFPFHLETTQSGRQGLAVYVERLAAHLVTKGADSLAVNHSLVVNANYRDNINVNRPNIPSLSTDTSLILRDAEDLTGFPKGFSMVSPLRMYLANDVNIISTGTDASGNSIFPPLSLFAPEKRFGVRRAAINIDFEGQLNYLGKDEAAPVRPLDLRSGVDDEVIADNIRAELYSISDISQLPPINQMNWLIVIEEVR